MMYYISFFGRKARATQSGPGFVIIERSEPIRSKDLPKLERDIKKHQKLAKVTIMNWNILEE